MDILRLVQKYIYHTNPRFLTWPFDRHRLTNDERNQLPEYKNTTTAIRWTGGTPTPGVRRRVEGEYEWNGGKDREFQLESNQIKFIKLVAWENNGMDGNT
jgi:hypothetical protein